MLFRSKETGEVLAPNMRAGDIIDNKEFWMQLFTETDFAKYIENRYKISTGPIMEKDDEN